MTSMFEIATKGRSGSMVHTIRSVKTSVIGHDKAHNFSKCVVPCSVYAVPPNKRLLRTLRLLEEICVIQTPSPTSKDALLPPHVRIYHSNFLDYTSPFACRE